jgi:acetylornithine deacetylase/succinyl-diaminopimelate desuccinylase-like protein
MNWAEYLHTNQSRFVDELLDFVRIPSVSAIDADVADVVTAGTWVVDRLQAAGAENVRMMPTDGPSGLR